MNRLVERVFWEGLLSVNVLKREHGEPHHYVFSPRRPSRKRRRRGPPELQSLYEARERTMRVSQAFYLIRTASKSFRARSFGETPKTLLW